MIEYILSATNSYHVETFAKILHASGNSEDQWEGLQQNQKYALITRSKWLLSELKISMDGTAFYKWFEIQDDKDLAIVEKLVSNLERMRIVAAKKGYPEWRRKLNLQVLPWFKSMQKYRQKTEKEIVTH